MYKSRALKKQLKKADGVFFVVLAGLASFAAYGCVYAIRKPFTAGAFAGLSYGGVDYKIALVIAQVLGYATSKFIGIQRIAALSPTHRMRDLLLMSGLGLGALLGLAYSPPEWGIFWMFLNGLPLGMAWGIIFSYLEGRRVTEALAALLCVNFIVSSGFVKTVGKWLLLSGRFTEFEMPFVTGLMFFPVLVLCIWLMEHLPKPSKKDRAARHLRKPMNKGERLALFRRFAPGIVVLVVIYLLLTVVRDMRDNFALEIWTELGKGNQPEIFTLAELPVAFFILVIVAMLAMIRDNFRALEIYHLIMIASGLLLLLITLLFSNAMVSPLVWMIGGGVFIILPYIIFNGIIFDRLMAAFRVTGNVGFLMYLADSFGYLGSVGVMLWRNFGQSAMSWTAFFIQACIVSAILIMGLGIFSLLYFEQRKPAAE